MSNHHGSTQGEELTVMCRQLVTVTLVGLAIAITASGSPSAASDEASVKAAPAVAVHHLSRSAPIRDDAAMILVGTVLIGLGAAVRRAA